MRGQIFGVALVGALLGVLGCGDESTVAVGGPFPDAGNNTGGATGEVPETVDTTAGGADIAAASVLVTQLSVNQGPTTGGTVLEIAGLGFRPDLRVLFGEADAEVHYTSGQRVAVVTPSGPEGAVDVTVINPDGGAGTLHNGFNYYDPANAKSPAPTLLKLSPNSGPAQGGTSAIVQGGWFQPGAAFFVDWRLVSKSEIASGTYASLVTPPMSEGSVDVAVTNPDGQSAILPQGFNAYSPTREVVPGPQIETIFPAFSPVTGGQIITITGAHFSDGTQLILGGAPINTWTIDSQTSGTFETPAHAAGLVSVALTNPDGQSDVRPNAILFWVQPPVIHSLEPPAGPVPGGNIVTLHGAHFLEGMTVTIGGKPCEGLILVAGDGAASESATGQCTVPPGDGPGPVQVAVQNPDGITGGLPGGYTYLSPTPAVTEVVPDSGPVGGDYIAAVRGADFQPTSEVWFGGAAAEVIGYAHDNLTVMVPAGAAGAVDVEVTAQGYPDALLSNGFTYVEQGPPQIADVSPGEGPVEGGTVVVVTGQDIRAESTVWFGAAAALDVLAHGSDAITVMLPAALDAGLVDVAIKTPGFADAVLQNGFSYLAPDSPTVTAVSPGEGPTVGGVVVAVQGTGFQLGSQVFFGAVAATDVLSIGPNGITVMLPAGGAAGPVDVLVKTPGFSDSLLPNGFLYVAADEPTLSAVLPTTGPTAGGGLVLVQGTGFQADSTVWFDLAKAAVVHVVGPGGIVVDLPPGTEGPADVRVQTPGASDAVLPNGFTYVAPDAPNVTACVPAEGPVEGGIVVLIEGSDLRPESVVWFGAVKATTVYTQGPNGIGVELPPGAAGTVDIRIATPGFDDAVLVDAFTYQELGPPSITQVVPKTGSTTGGQIVLVKGQNLRPQTSIWFGNIQSDQTVSSGAQGIAVILPAAGPGTVDVTAKTPGYADSVLQQAFTYEVPAPPPAQAMAIAQVLPATGPASGGGWVIIKGLNLPTTPHVTFGAEPSPLVHALTKTTLTARVPASEPGPVTVTVTDLTSGLEAALPAGYLYYADGEATAPTPVLETLKPAIGPALGNTLALLGGQAIQDGAFVFVDGKPAADVVVTGGVAASFRTPQGDPGVVDVTLVNPDGGHDTLMGAFVYTTADTPSIALTAVVPVQGTVAGGAEVTVTGSGFLPGTLVFLDGQPVTTQIVNGKNLLLVTPPHDPGLVDVQATAPDGFTAVLEDAYNFILQAPFIAGITPDFGPPAGGTVVVISGQGFHKDANVMVGESPCAVTVASETLFTCTTGPGALGVADVVVTNPDFLSNTLVDGFLYSDVIPGDSVQIHAVAPNVGPTSGGSVSTISGVGFGPDTSVIVGLEVAPSVVVLSDSALLVTMPGGPVGPKNVQVIVPEVGSASSPNAFFHYDEDSDGPWPLPSALVPPVGPVTGGTIARIDVLGATADAQVFFEGVAAEVLGWDGHGHLVVETPAHDAGTVNVVVMNPDGKAGTLSDAFTFYVPGPDVVPPVLVQVKPTSGSTLGGDPVTLTGASFTVGMLGFLGYRPLSDVLVSPPNTLAGITPAHAAGLVDAAVTRLDGFSAVLAAGFAFAPPAPDIQVVFPEVGHTDGGATVVITGEAFAPGATVFFGEAQAPTVTVVAPNVMTAITPPTAFAGVVDVLVQNPDGQKDTLPAAFEYTDGDFENPPPQVFVLQPGHGPFQGGTVLAIYGSGFQQGAKVLFGGKPALVHLIDEGLITVTTPPGFVGPVDVNVLNPDGQGGSLGAGFDYIVTQLPKPLLYGVTPKSGPETGGTPVILTGSKLTGGGLGFIGYRPLSSWTILNSAIATGTTVGGTPGPSDVVATNGDGQSAILDGGFNFVGAPVIDSFQPSMGAVAGGVLVNIAGQNFDSQATVTFGGKPAASLQVLSEFVIKAQTPASDPGPAQVRVDNPDGQYHVASEPFLFVLPPVLESVFPTQGSAEGGTPIILTGTDFLPGATVKLGGGAATEVSVVSAEKVTLFAPAGPVGETVAITLKNPDGQSAILAAAYTYVDPADIGPAPVADSLLPPQGPTTGGTWGLVVGDNLQAGAWAMIGVVPVADFEVLAAASARFVTAASPLAGAMNVTILNPDGGFGVLEGGFTYVDPAELDDPPVVTGITPDSGPTKGGTVVTLSGTDLTAGTLVFFATSPSPLVAAAEPDITAATPAHSLGAVNVTVTDEEGQTVTVEDGYEYVAPPVIIGLEPDQGPSGGGTFVTITGLYFRLPDGELAGSTVVVCEEWATQLNCVDGVDVEVVDDTHITFTTPELIPGSADVVVKNPDGQVAVAVLAFFYTPPPEILGIVPASGSTVGGEVVTITGKGFQPGMTITFAGIEALEVVIESGTKAICKTPENSPGAAAVTATNPDLTTHTIGGGYLYIRPPEIINIFPTLGPEPGGTIVTIQGKGFVPGLGDEGSLVFFGNQQVQGDDVDVGSNTLITCKSPPGVGPVAVRVVNPDEQFDVVAGGFIYIPVIPPPEVKSLQPTFGGTAGGYLVNVTGNNFLQGAQVSFGNDAVGWVNGSQVKVKNAGTLIVVTAPAHPVGKVDVKVTNSDGQFGVLPDSFEFAGALQLPGLAFLGVSPDRGPAEGGYDVVIYGQGFKTDVAVFWGHHETSEWMESAHVTRLGPTLLRVTMPNYNKSDIVDVRVVNPAYGGVADEVIGELAFTFGQSVVFEPKGQRLPNDTVRSDNRAVIFDANNDGLNDIMVFNSQYRDELYLNTFDKAGDPGQFIDVSLTAMPQIPTAWWREHAQSSDVDSDGDLDVVLKYNQYVGLYRNNGDGTFAFEYFGIGMNINGATDLDLGDLNCDGVPDMYITTTTTNQVAVGDGTGKFYLKSNVVPDHNEPSHSAALGDVDNDGDLDVVVANDNAFQNRLYYNNCNNTELPPSCTFEISGCKTATYSGHRYQFCPMSWSYWDARKTCLAAGYGMATISNQEEQDFLKTQMTYHTWMGYVDPDGDKSYEWEFGSSSYENWQPGQPDNVGNNCVIMNVSWGYKWDDQNCNSGYHFACEANHLDQCPNPWRFTDATYGKNKNFPVSGFNSKTAILADIDGDTWLDAVIINNGQTNRIYFNNGGSFLNDDGLHYPQDESGSDVGGDLVDVDLDGDLDLLVSRYIDASHIWPVLYLNDKAQGGAGIFTDATPVNLPAWRGEDTVFAAVGDLNSDSLIDLFIVNYNHQDWVLINQGFMENKPMLDQYRVPIGAFANNTFYGMPEAWTTTRRIAAGDIDDDGDLDIVLAAGDGGGAHRTRLWVNDGAGNFFDETETRLGDDNCDGYDVLLIDLNGDEDLDIMMACYAWSGNRGGLRQLVNDGDGVFTHVSTPNLPGNLPFGGRNHGIGAGDVDEDGDLDIFYGGYSWDWGVLVNGGDVFGNDGAFFLSLTADVLPSPKSGSERHVVVTDLNADTHLDVYIAFDGAQNSLYHNSGDAAGKMADVSQTHLPAINDSSRWAVANDVDFDGDIDLFTFNNGDNRLFVGELDYKYSDVTVSHLPTGLGADSQGGDVGDLDLDGFPDLISANWAQQNQLLLNQGDAHFGNFTDSVPRDIDYSLCATLADFDNDGRLDVFLCGSGVNRIYLNKTPFSAGDAP